MENRNLRILFVFGVIVFLFPLCFFPAFSADPPAPALTSSLLFRPFRAASFEPRVGAMYIRESQKLRLDIGNSIDLLAFQLSQRAEARLGADFFTYTRLRSEVNFRFPVETSDYFFGVNASLRQPMSPELAFLARVRVAHISSHLVDGSPQYADSSFVYSREFVDAVFALEWLAWRAYAGFSVLFHSIPDRFTPVSPQLGFDVCEYSWLGEYAGVCLGWDARIVTIDGITTAVQNAEGGVRFGSKRGTGVFLGLSWTNGKSVHGMFFNRQDRYLGFNFRVEF